MSGGLLRQSGRFTALENLTDPVLLWDTFKRETLDTAQESIGERPRARQSSISQETLEATDACRAGFVPFSSAQNSVSVKKGQGSLLGTLLRRLKAIS